MACSSNCRTQDHATWGECVRAKNIRPPALSVDMLKTQKDADKSLDAYASARAQGIQPKSTRAGDVRAAVAISETTGKAFTA